MSSLTPRTCGDVKVAVGFRVDVRDVLKPIFFTYPPELLFL